MRDLHHRRHLRHRAARWAAWPVMLLAAGGSPPAAADFEAPDFIATAQVSGGFRTGTNGGFGIECLQANRGFSRSGFLSFPGETLSGSSECAGLRTANARGLATASVTMNSVGASTYLAQGPELRTSTDSSVIASAALSSGLVVRPLAGVVPAPTVDVRLPFELSGSLNVDGPQPQFLLGAGGQSLATVQVSVTFGGQTFLDTRAALYPLPESNFVPDDPSSQMLEGGISPTVRLPVNTRQPFAISLTAKSEVVANGWAAGYFTASVSYAHTLTFGRTGPVFEVPEGYTVDAPGLGIVDNRYVGAVPEPAGAALFAAGLGVLALRSLAARARRARRPPGSAERTGRHP